jgi:cytochrome c peroxidase
MRRNHFLVAAAAALLSACGSPSTTAPETKAVAVPAGPPKAIGAIIKTDIPVGLPPIPYPADNPPTLETITLGRKLYYDKGLSSDGSVSCSFCHNPKFGFSDNQKTSIGIGGKRGGRNAPTVWNTAYTVPQFWDGRAPNLEEQAGGPMQNPIEMAHTPEGIEKRLDENSIYKEMFEKAYGPGPITFAKVRYAIAAFERTVLTGNSAFDKYQYLGNKKAMSQSAVRGLALFKDPKKGNCAVCHTIEEKYALFTDNKFHNLGVGVDKRGQLTDLGRYDVTRNEADRGAFKTPTLRNIAQTPPYMHDGSLRTLSEVVDFYVGGGNSNPYRDKEIRSLDFLTAQERLDLVAFMEALTGEPVPHIGPPEGEQ